MKRKSEQGEKSEKKVKINVPKGVLNKVCALMQKGKIVEAKALIPLEARHLTLSCGSTNDDPLLHYSVKIKCYDMIEHLLDGGADINCGRTRGLFRGKYTPLSIAVEHIDEKCCKLLLDRGAEVADHDLVQAIAHKQLSIFKLLAAKGAWIDANYQGGTLVHIAVDRGSNECLEWLLSNGAVDTHNDCNQTALRRAVEHGQYKCAKLLLDHKSDVNAVNDDKQTALHIAVKHKAYNCVGLLLDYKADVNARDDNQRTPLHYADDSTCKLLLARGADVHAIDAERHTVMQCAFERDQYSTVKLLLTAGAKPTETLIRSVEWKCDPQKLKQLQDCAELLSQLKNH